MPPVIADQSGELIQNGGFENGTSGWQTQGTVLPVQKSYYEPAHTGSRTCRIGDFRTGTGTLWQTVQLPSGAKATVSFWSRVELGTTLNVFLTGGDGSQINSWIFGGSRNPQWVQTTFEIRPEYSGQPITIKFTGQGWGEISCGYTLICPYGYYYGDYCYWTYVCNEYVYYFPYVDDVSIYYTVVKYAVDVSVEGLAPSATATIYVDNVASANLGNNQKKVFVFDIGSQHTISADEIVSGTEGVRNILMDKNPISVSSNGVYVLKYSTQYFLDVSSPIGVATGMGWHDAGSSVSLSLSPTSVPLEGVTGAIGAAYVFDHWTGSLTSTNPSETVVMDSPKKVEAIWRQDFQAFYRNIFVLISTNIVVIAVVLVWRQKRVPGAGAGYQAVGTIRICPSCGYELSKLPDDIQKCPYCAHDLN